MDKINSAFARRRRILSRNEPRVAIFQNVASAPTQLQRDLISQVTHIASIAIERTLNEEALRRSAAFLAQAQQLSRTGSFSWRVATDEITWSDELYRIYELDPGITITLEVIRTRVYPEDLTLYEKMVEQARNGAEDFEWQYRLLMPDQSIKYMHAVAQATRDPNGQLEYIAAVQDVTTRRSSEEALDKARSELARIARVMSLGALTASIAHEVNQPLSGIITNAARACECWTLIRPTLTARAKPLSEPFATAVVPRTSSRGCEPCSQIKKLQRSRSISTRRRAK